MMYITAFCKSCRTTATTNPKAVVSSATDIPPATTAGEISFAILISLKACIIPQTVPKKPSMGAVAIHKDIQVIFFSKPAISIEPDCSNAFSEAVSPKCALSSAVTHRLATGPTASSHLFFAASIPSDFIVPATSPANSSVVAKPFIK